MRRDGCLDALALDLRQAVRGLGQRRLVTAVAVVALALGVGANTLLFSVVEATLLRPLPFPEPERLVVIHDVNPEVGPGRQHPSPGNFLDWRSRNRVFAEMAAWYPASGTMRDAGGAEVVQVARVSTGFFDVLRVPPAMGRGFDARREAGAARDETEKVLAGDHVIVVSHGFWKRRLGADPAAVGREVSLDSASWRVIGVMPPHFRMPAAETDVWVPWDIPNSYAHLPQGTPRDFHFVNVVARLVDGVEPARAQAEMDALAAGLAREHPRTNEGWGVQLTSLREDRVGSSRRPLLALLGAVGFVLLLACANVASLQMAQGSARGREIAVRLALGASRARLVRQLLTESLVLAGVGAAAGLAVTVGGLRVLKAFPPPGLPRLDEAALNVPVFGFAAGIAVAAGVLFGLAPAWQAARRDASHVLKEEARSSTGGPRGQRTRRMLVVSEVALALVLLSAAGLLVRSFLKMRAVDPGFDPRGLLVLRVPLDTGTYLANGRAHAFYQALLPRLSALPGVQSVGAVTALPLSPVATDFDRPFWPAGSPPTGRLAREADIRMATPGYFRTMGMRLRSGRSFIEGDHRGAPRVVVVNETLARSTWTDGDAVGKSLVLDYLGGTYPYEVVGVVNDTHFHGLRRPPRPEVFIPHAQNPYLALSVVVRASGDPKSLARAARAAVTAVDPQQPVQAVTTMEDLLGDSLAADRSASVLMAAVSLVALGLAATGIYGALAFLVAQRTHEIGVRMALGAARRDILGLVLGESLRLTAAGAVMGLAGALAVGRAAAGVLFEVSPGDPLTLGLVTAALVTVALAAALWPARRAASVDPSIVLRGQ
jgi:putative ABC transport system permease protein